MSRLVSRCQVHFARRTATYCAIGDIKLGKIQRLHILRRQGGRRTVSAEITDRGSSRCDLGFEHEPGHVSVGAKDLIRRDPKYLYYILFFIYRFHIEKY